VPLHAYNRHRGIGNQAAEGRSRRERIKVHGEKLVVHRRPWCGRRETKASVMTRVSEVWSMQSLRLPL
jgi:hypothetical protein